MDCFVAEPVIGLAEGETRWLLAMTLPHLQTHGLRGHFGEPEKGDEWRVC